MAVSDCYDDKIDIVALHQANRMINDIIVKKIKVNPNKMPESLSEFGNTSSASIPLTLVVKCADALRNNEIKTLASGFGVGLSWGGLILTTDRITIPPILEI